jgi:hypothetical protein
MEKHAVVARHGIVSLIENDNPPSDATLFCRVFFLSAHRADMFIENNGKTEKARHAACG